MTTIVETAVDLLLKSMMIIDGIGMMTVVQEVVIVAVVNEEEVEVRSVVIDLAAVIAAVAVDVTVVDQEIPQGIKVVVVIANPNMTLEFGENVHNE